MFADEQIHQLSDKLKAWQSADENVRNIEDQLKGAVENRDRRAAEVAKLRALIATDIATGKPSTAPAKVTPAT